MSTFKITFDLPNGNLILEDTTDYSGAVYPSGATAIGVNYKVVSPSGTTIHNNTSTTDYDCYPLTDPEFSIPLPTDSEGNVLPGAYEVTMKTDFVDASGDVVETYGPNVVSAPNFNFTAPQGSQNVVIDYYGQVISSTDTTNYTVNGQTYTDIDRVMRIKHSNMIQPPVPDVTATGNFVSTQQFYGSEQGLEYVFELEATVTWVFTNYDVIAAVENTQQREIYVPDYICKVFCVLSALEKRYRQAKCGNERDLKLNFHPFIIATAYAQLMMNAYKCGKIASVEAYKEAIFNLGNAEDGCCCDEGNKPQLIVGIGGGAGTTIVQGVNGETTVSFDGSNTYTVGLAPEVLDLLNALNYDVTSDDGSISIQTSVEDGVTTFDLSLGSLAVSDRLDTVVGFGFTLVNLPTRSIFQQSLTGSVFQEVTQTAPNEFVKIPAGITNVSEWLNSPVYFELANFFSDEPQAFFPSVEIVGFKDGSLLENPELEVEVFSFNAFNGIFSFIRLKHASGHLVTGAWLIDNGVSLLRVKITLTA